MRLRSVMDQTGGEIFNVQDVSHLDAVFAAQGLCGAVQERILRALKNRAALTDVRNCKLCLPRMPARVVCKERFGYIGLAAMQGNVETLKSLVQPEEHIQGS